MLKAQLLSVNPSSPAKCAVNCVLNFVEGYYPQGGRYRARPIGNDSPTSRKGQNYVTIRYKYAWFSVI